MKVVITGAYGQLGLAFQQEFIRKGIPFWGTDLATCNITKSEEVKQVLDIQKPTVLINCAAYNLVDDAEKDQAAAFEVNTDAVKILSSACQERGIKFVHYSSDYVFDGKKGALYTEDDAVNPLNVYGRSKHEGEVALCKISANHLIFRTSWVYGHGKQNFLYKLSQWTKTNQVIRVSVDEISVPTYVEDIVWVTMKALEKGSRGLFHLTSRGFASRYEWAKAYVEAAGLKTQIMPAQIASFSLKAARPFFSAMSNQKISKELNIQIPFWQEGLEKYVRSMEGQ